MDGKAMAETEQSLKPKTGDSEKITINLGYVDLGHIDLLVLAMAYLVGHIFNVLPVPGGVGPVEGGMIGAMVAFGEPAGLALVATLAYQLISVWLPAVAGAFALWRVRHHHLVAAEAQ